jgi:hypothetical protein
MEGTMTPLGTVAPYYDAWQYKQGDFSEVPLADDFKFVGPIASFDNAVDCYARRSWAGGNAALLAHDPITHGPPSEDEIRRRLAASATLQPARGMRTTAAETEALLSAIWSDQAGPRQACEAQRRAIRSGARRHGRVRGQLRARQHKMFRLPREHECGTRPRRGR